MSDDRRHHNCDRDDREGDYGQLADAISDAFNPPDDDRAEESILVDAVYNARDFIAALPCLCTARQVTDYDACARCRALGRLGDKAVER